MISLPPWVFGPFELLIHAETHFRSGEDFDRRISLIGFDNSIEVSINTYLTLHPIHRQGRTYAKQDIENWLQDYHTKLDFFYDEIQKRSLPSAIDKKDVIYYHSIRNDQYHGGRSSIPEERALNGIREAALWIFGILFDVADSARVLEDELTQRAEAGKKPERSIDIDRIIDSEYGMVEIAGQSYYTSEALHSIDPVAYNDIGEALKKESKDSTGDN